MVMINRATKEITLKIVYYGPGLCGKTTNLEFIYAKANPDKRGKLLTVATETDRTLFFDFLPMELGSIMGMKLRVQLYTVPGQVFYDATRRIVLRGSDGIVFVADSQKLMMDANWESLENMKKNLLLNSLAPDAIPLVLQYNKQDLPNLASMEELEANLNWRKVPYFGAVATIGTGVNETVRKIIELVIRRLHDQEAALRHPQRAAEVPPSPVLPPPPEAAVPLDKGLAAVPVAPAPPPRVAPEPPVPMQGPVDIEDTSEELAGVEVETEFDVGPAAPKGRPEPETLPELEMEPSAPAMGAGASAEQEFEMEGELPPPDTPPSESTALSGPPPPVSSDLPEIEVTPTIEPLSEVEDLAGAMPAEAASENAALIPAEEGITGEPEALPISALESGEAETLPISALEIDEAEVSDVAHTLPPTAVEEMEIEVEEPPDEAPAPQSVPSHPPEAAGVPLGHEALARDVEGFRRELDDMLLRLRGCISDVEDLKARLTEIEGRLK